MKLLTCFILAWYSFYMYIPGCYLACFCHSIAASSLQLEQDFVQDLQFITCAWVFHPILWYIYSSLDLMDLVVAWNLVKNISNFSMIFHNVDISCWILMCIVMLWINEVNKCIIKILIFLFCFRMYHYLINLVFWKWRHG